jgi:hypothetical protein
VVVPYGDGTAAIDGYTVGLGWLPLIERLIVRLIALGWNREVAQIKPKFGGLRFYVGVATDAMHEAIQEAEEESLRTCDACGLPGRFWDIGHYVVRCERHRS